MAIGTVTALAVKYYVPAMKAVGLTISVAVGGVCLIRDIMTFKPYVQQQQKLVTAIENSKTAALNVQLPPSAVAILKKAVNKVAEEESAKN